MLVSASRGYIAGRILISDTCIVSIQFGMLGASSPASLLCGTEKSYSLVGICSPSLICFEHWEYQILLSKLLLAELLLSESVSFLELDGKLSPIYAIFLGSKSAAFTHFSFHSLYQDADETPGFLVVGQNFETNSCLGWCSELHSDSEGSHGGRGRRCFYSF